MIQRSGPAKESTGKNVPLNSIIGTSARVTYSKSCQLVKCVVTHIPTPANARPMSSVAGSASTAHHDDASPSPAMIARNPAE